MKRNEFNENKKKRKIVDEKDFFIPNFDEYYLIKNNNYRVSFLKDICKYYKQKLSGNKKDLEDRIFIYLRHSFFANKVQKIARGYIQRKFNKLLGPGFINKKLCKNDCDFFTLEEISEIPYNQFISYQDSNNNIWGFNIISLYNLFLKNKNNTLNPFTREKMSANLIENINQIIKLGKYLNIECDIKLKDISDELDSKKKFEMRVLQIFQKIDELGNYTNTKWFFDLNKLEIIRFLRELADIWFYRAGINDQTRRNICPPMGILFKNVNLNYISNLSQKQLQKLAMNLVEQIISNGISRDFKIMGSYYVLSALTLVNNEAAEALPWLYQSVMY